MPESLLIRRFYSTALPKDLTAAMYRLCDAAYECPTAPYFEDLGNGEHLLGFHDGALVSHLMWVTRWLEPDGLAPLRTAYVEMVATDPAVQRRGYASGLLEELVAHVGDYVVAALCPATEGVYARLGWRFWRGPLAARRDGTLVPTPEERVMLLPLPRTPPLPWDTPLSIEWRPGEIW